MSKREKQGGHIQEEEEGVSEGGGEGFCIARRQHKGDTSVAVLTFSSLEHGGEHKPMGPESCQPGDQMQEQSWPKYSPAHRLTSVSTSPKTSTLNH